MSRRKFLGFSLTAVLASMLGGIRRDQSRMLSTDSIQKEMERRDLIAEIIQCREQIGLAGIPEKLAERRATNASEKWPIPETAIMIQDVPEINKSFATRALAIANLCLGARASEFIQIIKTDPVNGAGNTFDSSTRTYNLNRNVRDQLFSLELFTGLVLHECIGHPTDPDLFWESMQIPFDVFLKIEHGKWLALTQAFSVDQEFLRHPGDGVLPAIKAAMASDTARILFESQGDFSIVTNDIELQGKLRSSVLEIANVKNMDDVFFNRAFCAQFGDVFVELLLSNPNFFQVLNSDLHKKYQASLEHGLREIYAEMVRISLEPKQELAPNNHVQAVQANTIITQGVEEVLSAIRSERCILSSLRTLINSLIEDKDDAAVLRNADEASILQSTTDLSRSADPIVSQQDREQDALESAVADFYNGTIPTIKDLTNEDALLIQEFSTNVHKAVQAYPIFQIDEDLFDHPHMHIWDIDYIAEAMSSYTIRLLVAAILNGDDIHTLIEKYQITLRTQVISDFLEKYVPNSIGRFSPEE